MLRDVKLTGLFVLLTFPLFYFSYKHLNPEPIAHDFFQYYRLYKDFDVSNVNTPLNMRLIGAFIVYLFYNKLNLYYETQTAFDVWVQFGFLKQVFFCAMFFNYLCVVATCLVICSMARRFVDNMWPVLAGLAYLLGFGTVFYALAPLSDATAILLFALFLHAYLGRSRWAYLSIVLLVFQREYLLLVIALLSLMDYIRYRQRYFVFVFSASIIGFVIYFILRETVFYTPALRMQTDPGSWWHRLTQMDLLNGTYLRQTLMTMNLVFVYLSVVAWKLWNKLPVDKYALLQMALLFVQVNLLSAAGGLGNNNGRYFYMTVPLVILFTVKEAQQWKPAVSEPGV